MNDKMKTAISIIAIAGLCACTSTNEQTQVQTPRTEDTAPAPYKAPATKNQNWGKVTNQEWKTIIQQLSARELFHVYTGMTTIPDGAMIQLGHNPYPRISPELKRAARARAHDLFEDEYERRKSLEQPHDYEQERKPLILPRTAPSPMEDITTSFPQRLNGYEPDFLWGNWHTSQLLEKLSLNELKSLRNESKSKMTDEELLMTEREIEQKENTALIAEQMLNDLKRKKEIQTDK